MAGVLCGRVAESCGVIQMVDGTLFLWVSAVAVGLAFWVRALIGEIDDLEERLSKAELKLRSLAARSEEENQ